jgi:alkanesulfonate monooxygenase SsuD/methylene tetrahydromethanopterin reductase-like flavin-dependent oxidoreductase (luciferase family)
MGVDAGGDAQVWAGEIGGQGGPMLELPEGRPALLFGGLIPTAYERAAMHGQEWVAPLFGLSLLQEGTAAVQEAWAEGGTARPIKNGNRSVLQSR